MDLLEPFRRWQRSRKLRVVTQVRSEHRDCFCDSPLFGGSIDVRSAQGPTVGLSDAEAARIGIGGYCDRGHNCRKLIKDLPL